MASSAEPTGEINPPKRLRATELGEERWSGGEEENRGQVDVVGVKIVCVFASLQMQMSKADSSNACFDCK